MYLSLKNNISLWLVKFALIYLFRAALRDIFNQNFST